MNTMQTAQEYESIITKSALKKTDFHTFAHTFEYARQHCPSDPTARRINAHRPAAAACARSISILQHQHLAASSSCSIIILNAASSGGQAPALIHSAKKTQRRGYTSARTRVNVNTMV
jgi:hypothetical protein